MIETETGPRPAETDVLAAAAEAFKISLGQAEAPAEPAPDASGENETGPEPADAAQGEEAAAGADDAEPAADPDEPEPATPLPASWPRDKAALWDSLPAEAQGFIALRDGQRDAALNARFMAAAELRKAHEAERDAARQARERALEAAELALALIRPAEPPLSMLEAGSPDYNPDAYHLARARADRSRAELDALAAQRQDLLAQARADEESETAARHAAINAASRDALLADLPDLADQAKAPAVLRELIDYAVEKGAPPDLFATPTTALEWHTLWKAREYDRLQAAKAELAAAPKPAPRRASPPVRPSVAVPPSARAAARRQQDLDRLAASGSVADGAAVFKHFLKG